MLLIKLKGIILWIQRMLLRPEPMLTSIEPGDGQEPIFIIGAPRTGSTLLFQLLILRFRLGYISNLMALAPMFLSRVACLFKGRILRYDTLKKSDYGVIGGLHAPNEAAKVNDHWFREVMSPEDVETVRKSIYHSSRCVNAPMLIKSMANALRLDLIVRIFPRARFIHIRRDPLFTGQSILLARKDLLGSYNDWWSLRPKGYEEIHASQNPYYQVLWQIKSVDDQVHADLERLDAAFMTVDYNRLCDETTAVLDEIGKAFGLVQKEKTDAGAKARFSERIKLVDAEWKSLKEAHAMLYGQ